MNRIEYMSRLAALLQDVPEEERVAAMHYYNDYFDDAGEENEAKVIEELGSPEKVAAEMKAGLGPGGDDSKEFRETGYADAQFEQKEAPTRYQSGVQSGKEEKPWSNKGVKILLIVLIVLVAAPVIVPVGLGVLCCVVGVILAVFGIFLALVIAAICVAIAGGAVFVAGIVSGFVNFPVALIIMGAGLLLGVLGVIGTVVAVRLCVIVLPGLTRFVVELLRKPFHRRKAVG